MGELPIFQTACSGRRHYMARSRRRSCRRQRDRGSDQFRYGEAQYQIERSPRECLTAGTCDRQAWPAGPVIRRTARELRTARKSFSSTPPREMVLRKVCGEQTVEFRVRMASHRVGLRAVLQKTITLAVNSATTWREAPV